MNRMLLRAAMALYARRSPAARRKVRVLSALLLVAQLMQAKPTFTHVAAVLKSKRA